MLQVPRAATLIKRDFDTGFFLLIFMNYSETSILFWGSITADSETPVCAFLRKPLFTEHLQWLLLTVSGFQPAILLKKRLQQRRFSVNFVKILRQSINRTPPAGLLLLVYICESWEVFQITSFIELILKTAYFMYKLQNFKHQIQQNVFHQCFSSI